MFEEIRNKYLYNKTQIIEFDKEGKIISSDDSIYLFPAGKLITDIHPFFETVSSLLFLDNEEHTFTCVHLEIDSKETTIDILFNSGNEEKNPFLILFDFTEHYTNFQNISQEKNESILSFHLAELKNKQLETEKTFKNNFLANVSHDLKTPISATLWFVGMLEKAIETKDEKELIELLKDTTNHIKGLVDDILDLSKIELGHVKLHPVSFDFLEMIKHIKKIIYPKARTKNLEFSIVIDNRIPQFLIGDKTRIVQILINLLDNAVKFTKKGTIKLSVFLKNIENETVNLHIEIQDTGIGIKTNHKEIVFESFKKVHNSTKIEGSGLGLSIVSNLLNLMKGSIDYSSEINVGTTFFIELPMQVESVLNDEKSTVKHFVDSKDNLNVLIVEDNEINQLLLMKLLLNHGGFNINIANNGFQALEMVEQKNYDLLFVDKEMPQMNGIKITSTIRENLNPNINSIPIIGVSGNSIKHNSEEIDALGFNGYVKRPFKKEKLYDTIYKVLKTNKIFKEKN